MTTNDFMKCECGVVCGVASHCVCGPPAATNAYISNDWDKCTCEPADNCSCGPEAEYDALCALVDAFAVHMKSKLRDALTEGRRGWEHPNFESDCQKALLMHVIKAGNDPGDYVDVANFAAFAWNFRVKACPCVEGTDLCGPCMQITAMQWQSEPQVERGCYTLCSHCGGVGVVGK